MATQQFGDAFKPRYLAWRCRKDTIAVVFMPRDKANLHHVRLAALIVQFRHTKLREDDMYGISIDFEQGFFVVSKCILISPF